MRGYFIVRRIDCDIPLVFSVTLSTLIPTDFSYIEELRRYPNKLGAIVEKDSPQYDKCLAVIGNRVLKYPEVKYEYKFFEI